MDQNNEAKSTVKCSLLARLCGPIDSSICSFVRRKVQLIELRVDRGTSPERYTCLAFSYLQGPPEGNSIGVTYGIEGVTVVKEKRFTGIQRKPAAWIAP